jgi:hypothetical protein
MITMARRIARVLRTGLAIGLCACGTPAEHASPPPVPPSNHQDVHAGSAGSASAAATGPHTMQPTLAVKLLASPTQLTMADRSKFLIGVEVKNQGPAAVDPQLSTSCELSVNGTPSMSWNLAIGNGTRDATWYLLPPGKTATMSWPLGVDLFDKPGDYHLVMTLGAQTSTADVRVSK